MSERVTQRQLESMVRVLNNSVGTFNAEPWTRDDQGTLHATIGHFYVDGAYGGVALYRMVTDGGGVTDVSGFGHQPKRRLYDFLRGMLEGVTAANTETAEEVSD